MATAKKEKKHERNPFHMINQVMKFTVVFVCDIVKKTTETLWRTIRTEME